MDVLLGRLEMLYRIIEDKGTHEDTTRSIFFENR